MRRAVADRLGFWPDGRIDALCNLRYFGMCFNPITPFYIYAAAGRTAGGGSGDGGVGGGGDDGRGGEQACAQGSVLLALLLEVRYARRGRGRRLCEMPPV